MHLANKARWLVILGVVAIGVLASSTVFAQSTLQILLTEQNASGETGTASITDLGDGTVRVDVVVNNAPEGVVQPLHIHEGTCANLNPAPAYPLQSVENGLSSTVVEVTLDDLLAAPYAINGHKSAEEASVYVFCGDIFADTSQATTTAQPTDVGEPMMGTTVPDPTVVMGAETPMMEATAESTTMMSTETPMAEMTAEPTMMMATGAATTEAMSTPSAEATPATVLPGTGGSPPIAALVLLAILGVGALIVGFFLRERGRQNI